jgi:hypothetical protein
MISVSSVSCFDLDLNEELFSSFGTLTGKESNDAYAKVVDYSTLNRAFMFQCDEVRYEGGDIVQGQHICLSGWENGYQG